MFAWDKVAKHSVPFTLYGRTVSRDQITALHCIVQRCCILAAGVTTHGCSNSACRWPARTRFEVPRGMKTSALGNQSLIPSRIRLLTSAESLSIDFARFCRGRQGSTHPSVSAMWTKLTPLLYMWSHGPMLRDGNPFSRRPAPQRPRARHQTPRNPRLARTA